MLLSEEERAELYNSLLEVVTPYLGDFVGIDAEGRFDIVLAIQELLED